MAARRVLAAAAFFGVALFLSVSFVSYDGVSDPAELSSFANLGGEVGKGLASVLLRTFGAGSFALAFFFMFVGYSVLIDRRIETPLLKCFGALLATLALGTAIQAIAPTAGYARSPFLLGGVAGDFFAVRLCELFGGIGTSLILMLLTASAVVLATDRFFLELFVGLGAVGSDLLSRIKGPALAFAGALATRRPPPAKAPARAARKPRKSRKPRKAPTKTSAAVSDDDEGDEDEGDELELAALAELDRLMADEDAGDEDADEEEEEYEEEEEDEEGEDEGVELEDDDEEEEEEEAGEEAPRPEPVIRRGRVTTTGDEVEILKLSREKHLAGKETYELPPLSLLDEPDVGDVGERDAEIRRKARKLEETLGTFGIDAQVVEISRGPTITVYEIELAAGTKVKRITALPDDISMALKAKTIRIVAPIPGKSTVGIEVPNDGREKVCLRELALSDTLRKKHFNIPLFLGKDASGNPLIEDLTQMPHLLIAGQTGSGKSVCINSVIASLLLTKYPEEVRLILIDPKMVELQAFRNVPHLLTPVVTDMKKAPKVLEWAVNEMEQRYELLSAASVRDIKGFNDLDEDELEERLEDHYTPDEMEQVPRHIPYVVLMVDELADLMMTSAKEVESSICRLAQKSRAVGIHVILATQRPSVDVITGLIKSNMPSRLSFRVASKIDSRTILDQMGAERLLGKGDMLWLSPRSSGPVRCQAALVSDREIMGLVRYIKDVAQPEYSRELMQVRSSASPGEGPAALTDRDPLYPDAIRIVLASQRGSVSMLQRKLEIGYTRAARLIDFMAEDGLVGSFKGSKAREVLKTLEDWEQELKAAENE